MLYNRVVNNVGVIFELYLNLTMCSYATDLLINHESNRCHHDELARPIQYFYFV